MAIKQRALMKLDMTKKHVLHVMRTRNKAALGEVYRDLTEARDLYREGLPRSGYAAYGEIYDGLILAVQKVMEGGEANFQEEVLTLCQELLEHLERETAKETRFKKEIFFLPYKLSMFDSLESVWRAADKDKEHCNAYVMPIPYADRNPDQTVAAWHCERDQFPKDVPTLDWQQVDLKAWHPDIIVYHSPYDNCNAVTSVDEQYYSRNLRYCADKLVYIPYFVLDEIEPGNETTEESIAHFITAPGVLNADLIVVQSEKMRQVYIHVLARHTNQGEEYWEEHVSGAGSPKIEKVLTSKKEDFDMPERWRELVEGKKVILYNTSLSAMLQNSDKVCDKLRYVFDVFRNRDDVVLWWRPHPLMKATFHSMRPQFEKEYLSLEKQYIEEGWGIYDDSPDLHRAIYWSDAYYGDASSVISMYKVTNKPLLIQSMRYCCKKEYNHFLGHFAVSERYVWFVSATDVFLALYQIDIRNGKVKCLGELPIAYKEDHEYVALGQIKNKIIIAPYRKSHFFIEYDLGENRFHSRVLTIPHYDKCNPCMGLFANVVCYQTSLFFIANSMGVMIEFDGTTERYTCHDIWKESWPLKRSDAIFGNEAYTRHGHCIYMLIPDTSFVIEIDLTSCETKLYKVPVAGCDLASCSFDGEHIWGIPVEGNNILKWRLKSNEVEFTSLASGWNDKRDRYGIHVQLGEIMLVLPRFDSQILVYNKTFKKFYWTSCLMGDYVRKNIDHYVGSNQSNENKTYLYLYQEKILKIIDNATGAYEDCILDFSWDETLDRYRVSFAACVCNVNSEEGGIGIDGFLDCVDKNKRKRRLSNHTMSSKIILTELLQ